MRLCVVAALRLYGFTSMHNETKLMDLLVPSPKPTWTNHDTICVMFVGRVGVFVFEALVESAPEY